MPISGYDPDDVEQLIETTLTEKFDHEQLASRLPDDEFERVDSGERLVDVLDEETIDTLLDEEVFN
jgi:hypothetical protein